MFFICDLFAQVEDDKMRIIARPDQPLTYTQIKNLLRSVRRDRYHIFEEHSIDSLMIPGTVWRDTAGYLKYMDWGTDSTGKKYTKIWILNKDTTDSLTADTNNITSDGQENYYAVWKDTKKLGYDGIRITDGRTIVPNLTTIGRVDINNGLYGGDPLRLYSNPQYGHSEISDLYGSLFVNSNNTNIQGGLTVGGGNFNLQGNGLYTYSSDVMFNDSPIKADKYIIVGSPRPPSANDGDVVAKRFVAFTSASKAGITITINIVTNNGVGTLEITGGIITGFTLTP